MSDLKQLIADVRAADHAYHQVWTQVDQDPAEEKRLWETKQAARKKLREAVPQALGVNAWELADLCQG